MHFSNYFKTFTCFYDDQTNPNHLNVIIKIYFPEIDLFLEQINELIFISWKEVAVAAASEEQEECNLSLLVMAASTQALLYMNWCMLSVRTSYASIYNIKWSQRRSRILRFEIFSNCSTVNMIIFLCPIQVIICYFLNF